MISALELATLLKASKCEATERLGYAATKISAAGGEKSLAVWLHVGQKRAVTLHFAAGVTEAAIVKTLEGPLAEKAIKRLVKRQRLQSRYDVLAAKTRSLMADRDYKLNQEYFECDAELSEIADKLKKLERKSLKPLNETGVSTRKSVLC